MKLSDWAKKNNISYTTALRWFKNGKLPVKAHQVPSGMIMVDIEEDKYKDNDNIDDGVEFDNLKENELFFENVFNKLPTNVAHAIIFDREVYVAFENFCKVAQKYIGSIFSMKDYTAAKKNETNKVFPEDAMEILKNSLLSDLDEVLEAKLAAMMINYLGEKKEVKLNNNTKSILQELLNNIQNTIDSECQETEEKIKKASEKLNELINKGKVSENEIPQLLTFGLDPKVIAYWQRTQDFDALKKRVPSLTDEDIEYMKNHVPQKNGFSPVGREFQEKELEPIHPLFQNSVPSGAKTPVERLQSYLDNLTVKLGTEYLSSEEHEIMEQELEYFINSGLYSDFVNTVKNVEKELREINEKNRDNEEFEKIELIEVNGYQIPANPEALRNIPLSKEYMDAEDLVKKFWAFQQKLDLFKLKTKVKNTTKNFQNKTETKGNDFVRKPLDSKLFGQAKEIFEKMILKINENSNTKVRTSYFEKLLTEITKKREVILEEDLQPIIDYCCGDMFSNKSMNGKTKALSFIYDVLENAAKKIEREAKVEQEPDEKLDDFEKEVKKEKLAKFFAEANKK